MRYGPLLAAAMLGGMALPAVAQTELSLWYHGAGSANAEEALVNHGRGIQCQPR